MKGVLVGATFSDFCFLNRNNSKTIRKWQNINLRLFKIYSRESFSIYFSIFGQIIEQIRAKLKVNVRPGPASLVYFLLSGKSQLIRV